jgi:hypothetical protein
VADKNGKDETNRKELLKVTKITKKFIKIPGEKHNFITAILNPLKTN